MSIMKGPFRTTGVVTAVTSIATSDLTGHVQNYDTSDEDKDASVIETTTTTTAAKKKKKEEEAEVEVVELALKGEENEDPIETESHESLESQRKTRIRHVTSPGLLLINICT